MMGMPTPSNASMYKGMAGGQGMGGRVGGQGMAGGRTGGQGMGGGVTFGTGVPPRSAGQDLDFRAGAGR